MLRSVKSHQRKVRHLYFHVDGTGTAALTHGGTEGSLTDNGTGNYTVTLADEVIGHSRVLNIQATSITDNVHLTVAISGAAITCKADDNAGTATDADFYLLVVLSDAADATV